MEESCEPYSQEYVKLRKPNSTMDATDRTPENVNGLVLKWRSGESTPKEQRELSNIIEDRVRFILSKVRIPNTYFTEREELVSIGILAAFDRMLHWSEDKGDFLTFSYFRIQGSVIDHFRRVDPMPRPARVVIGKTRKASNRLEQKLGRPPTSTEISEVTGVPVEDIESAVLMSNSRQQISIYMPDTGSEDDSDMLSVIAGDEDYEPTLAGVEVEAAFQTLPERSREIMTDFYIRDISQPDIAKRQGLTIARISQIRMRCIEDLRGELDRAV